MSPNLFLFSMLSVFSQSETPGYHWVIEVNVQPSYSSTIRFYKNGSIVVYEETINEAIIDIKRKRVRKQLDKMLKIYIRNPDKFIGKYGYRI